MKTELCDVLGIEYPIIQGAMAHISDGKFAATVSEAGGLGVIASTLHDGQWVKEQVEIARSITDKPFAVNLIMESDIVEECARMCVELKVPICTISAGNPEKIVPILVEGGIKVICLIPHARAAKKMQDLGATAVVAEGMEGGGHIGKMCTFPMVRQVAEAVDIPVIAAGGIADGKGFMAALMLGAVGVQMGTAFLVAEECPISVRPHNFRSGRALYKASSTRKYSCSHPNVAITRCTSLSKYWQMPTAALSINAKAFNIGVL